MELNDLVIFSHVARLGSMSAAAHALGYVQSNITTRVRRLEQELHTELFIRTPRGVQLLPAGERLLMYADRMVELMEQAQAEFRSVTAAKTIAPLRIGATFTITSGYLTEAIINGELALEVYTRSSRELIVMLLAGELDGILLNRPWQDQPEQAICQFMIQENIGWTMPIASFAKHSVTAAEKKSLPEQLLDYPVLVMRDTDCPYHQATLDYIDRYPEYVWNIRHVDSLDTMLTLIRHGQGVAILPQRIAQQADQTTYMSWQPLLLAGKQPVHVQIAYYECKRNDNDIEATAEVGTNAVTANNRNDCDHTSTKSKSNTSENQVASAIADQLLQSNITTTKCTPDAMKIEPIQAVTNESGIHVLKKLLLHVSSDIEKQHK